MRDLRLGVCLPVFNEADVISGTLQELARELARVPTLSGVDVVLVDDGSSDDSARIATQSWQALPRTLVPTNLHVVRLAANQGHQRALLRGLRQASKLGVDACLVMDADGQDDPSVVPAMVEKLKSKDIVFAQRGRRSEGLLWTTAYMAYQAIFRVLLGRTLFFGNYLVMTKRVLRHIVRSGDLSHLASMLSNLPFGTTSVPVDRRERSGGTSKMGIGKLVDYGIAAMTTSEHAWIRLFTRLSGALAAFSALGFTTVVGIRLFTDLAIAGWASVVSLILFSISFQSLGFLALTTFVKKLMTQLSPVSIPVSSVTRVEAGGAATLVESDGEERGASGGETLRKVP